MHRRWFLLSALALAAGCGTDPADTPVPDPTSERPATDVRPNNPDDVTDDTSANNAVANNAPANNATPNNATSNNDVEVPSYGEWFESFGGTDADIAEDVAADEDGNVYVTGTFRDTITIGDEVLTAIPGTTPDPTTDIFVASFTPGGAFRWATAFGSDANEKPFGIATAPDGGVFVVGDAQGDIAFETSTLPALGQGDLFAVKFDTDGEYQWAQNWGGMFTENARDIDVNAAGDLFITGSWQGLFTAGNVTYTAETDWSAMEVLVLAIDGQSGGVKWVNSYNGFLIDTGTAISADANGNVAVGVSFQYDVDIQGETFDAGESFGGAIVKLDSSGSLQWVKRLEGDGDTEVLGIELADDGSVYATGVFTNTVNFGGEDLVNPVRGHDVFMLGLDTDGNHLYSTSYGGEGFDQPLDMTARDGTLYVTGRFDGEITFADTRLESMTDEYDIFVTSFEASSGKVRWARGFGGPLADQANGIAVGPGRGVYIAGYGDGGDFMFNDMMQPAASAWVDAVVFRLEE